MNEKPLRGLAEAATLEKTPSLSDWTNGIAAQDSGPHVVRLLCFPYAGGGASLFRSWRTELSPAIDVYPIQLPGREGRWQEKPFSRLIDLARVLSQALAPLLRPPYVLAGHSMGAFIAFELARSIRRANRPGPSHLIVSGARAPQIPDPEPPIHQESPDQLFAELQRHHGIPQEVLDHPELLSLLLPTLRADLEMCETYVYADEPPLSCPITVFGGVSDSKVPLAHLTEWHSQTSGEFQIRMFPGNHFFIFKEARAAVVQAMREGLRRYAAQPIKAPVLQSHTDLEQTIAGVWREVLNTRHVGAHDNFFDLGGNSLLMVRVYEKLRTTTRTNVSVLDLFRYPTISLLAKAMDPSFASASFDSVGGTPGWTKRNTP